MLRSKKIFLPLLLLNILAICFRSWLIITNTDMAGLYVDLSSKAIIILRVITIVSALIGFIVPLLDEVPDENRIRNSDKLLGITMLIFGFIMIFVGIVDFFGIFQVVWSSNLSEFKTLLLNTPNSIMRLVLSLITMIIGWKLNVMAVKILNNQKISNNYSLGIILVIWSVIRSLLFTRSTTTIATIPDNLYSVMTIIFSISFLFGISKLLFDVRVPYSGYKIAVSSGNLVVLFGLLNSIPNYIAVLIGKNAFFSVKDTNGVTNLMLAIFAIVSIYIIVSKPGENKQMFDR